MGLSIYAPETDGERQLVVLWQAPTDALGRAFMYEYFVQWVDSSGADSDWNGAANVSDDNVTVIVTLNELGNYTFNYTITNLTACTCYNVNFRTPDGGPSTINHCTRPNSIIFICYRKC